MTGCCILGCNNNSEKGFSLRRFPTNKERKALWVQKIGRKNWEPSPYSHICEIHFAEDMWEKLRIDGKRKLKYNAVPTIFPIIKKKEENKDMAHTIKYNVQNIPKISNELNFDVTSTTFTSDDPCFNESTWESSLQIEESSLQIEESSLQIEELKKKLNEANKKLQIANRIVYKAEKTKRNLLHQIRKLKSQKRLRIEKSVLKSSEILRKVFNSDQIEWLQQDSPIRRVYKWSEETIRKALRLKFCCSEHCYNELRAQNIPLPSTRTLRRSIETLNFQPGICDDIFEALKVKISQFQDDRERDCMLALDEVSLAPGKQNDASTNSFIGYATIPNSHGKLTN